MSQSTIIIRSDGPVLQVINNNPGSKNSLSAGFIDGFIELDDEKLLLEILSNLIENKINQ